MDISIHAPREGSDDNFCKVLSGQYISIHAPREGSDMCPIYIYCMVLISIHAPREGSDDEEDRCVFGAGYFNPRSP